MNPDRIHVQRINALDYWKGPISLQALPGGITNRNFLVQDGERSYFARLCEERPLLGIDRRNERVCQKAAGLIGIAPQIVHHEEGILIGEFVRGRTMTAEAIREPAFIRRLAAVLRRLHDSWDQLASEMLYFSVFQAVRAYAETARQLNARLPENIEDLLRESNRLSHRISPFIPTLCHNDLLAANLIDDSERIWLVDWEYAGIGHPLFDLAGLSGNCGFSESRDLLLLETYRGHVDERDLRELRILKAMSLLREALWAIIQTVASDIDFDYHKYAGDNLRAYEEARSHLTD